MDSYTFISEIVKSVAWPMCTVGIVIVARPALHELMGGLRRLRWKDVEAEFERELSVVRDITEQVAVPIEPAPMIEPGDTQRAQTMLRLAELSPRAVVIDAWAALEAAGRAALPAAPGAHPLPAARLGDALLEAGALDDATFQIYSILRALRNRVAHEHQYQLDPGEALEYASFASAVVDHLEARETPR